MRRQAAALLALFALYGCAGFEGFLDAELQAPTGYDEAERTLVLETEAGEFNVNVPSDGVYTGEDVVADAAQGVALAVTGDEAKAAGIGAAAMLLLGLARRKRNQEHSPA